MYNILNGRNLRDTIPICLLLIILLSIIPVTLASPVTVTTDKTLYKIGDSISVTGSATPNAYITIQLFDPQGLRAAIGQTQASTEGSYSKLGIYRFTGTDTPGEWRIFVLDATRQESSETIFTLAAPIPVTLDLTITPNKSIYKSEPIVITITADQPIKNVLMHVSQVGAPTIPVTLTSTDSDNRIWSGTYNIVEGYDGTATIEVAAEDNVENKVEKKITFTVDTVSPRITISAPSRSEVTTITVTGTVDDPTISKIQLSVVPSAPISVSVTDLKWSQEVTLTSTGSNTILATAIDGAGNEGSTSTLVIYAGILEAIAQRISDLEALIGEVDQLSESVNTLDNEVSNLTSKVSNLTSLVTIAVIFSLIAAALSIYTVVTITRRLVLK